jgi:TolB protein
MRQLILISAIGLALLGTASSAAPATTAPRELTFVRGEASSTEIHVVREDGSGLRRLTRNRFADYSPIWSPDGKRILFVSNRDGDDELFLMDAAGKNLRRLTGNRAADLTPQWSPDGRWIAFASDRARPGEPEIWVMRADGSGAHRLVASANHPWQDRQYSPTWSPDGRRIVFTMAASAENPELYVVGADGRGLKRLTRTGGTLDDPADDTMPDWAADGRTIVFVSNRGRTTSDLWTMRADGSGQRPLSRRPSSDDWNPRLSPDGDAVAFTEHVLPGGPAWVSVLELGGGSGRVTRGSEPDWRPR